MCSIEDAILSLAPESESILPSMAPNAMVTPVSPSVEPAPVSIDSTILSMSNPEVKPTKIAISSSASSGWNYNLEVIKKMRNKILTTVIINS